MDWTILFGLNGGILKEMPKGMNEIIKKWNKKVYEETKLKFQKLMNELNALDLRCEY